MKFVWGGDRLAQNVQLVFSIRLEKDCDTLAVCAVDSYQIFADGEFLCYGPERTAAGYVRRKLVNVAGKKQISVKVTGYNVATYAVDFQSPFFGAELSKNGAIVYDTQDFSCVKENARLSNMPRYSCQRGFVEGYDFTKTTKENVPLYEVESPKILKGIGERADYATVPFDQLSIIPFEGFEWLETLWWERSRCPNRPNDFSIRENLIEETKQGYMAADYVLNRERTGFIRLEIEAEEPMQLFVGFEEYLPEDKWLFRRSKCNDFIFMKIPSGRTSVISCEPYALKYLKILYKGRAKITPSLVTYENAFAKGVSIFGDDRIVNVFEAARNSFCQNAVDIFTDCPGRERAGWLCDSYFTAQAELLFTGKNEIEKAFLENFLLAETPEIDKGMLPKCFPSEHIDKLYIPNWGMWFAIEICDYYKRTADWSLPLNARQKIYDLIDFFKKYLNEYGLLENLESWVFLEWSISNDKDYICGVNFPSNMLYAYMLEEVGKLYSDKKLLNQAKDIKNMIIQLAFNGDFFVDNAIRENGILRRCENHISETCQYYALFTGLCPTAKFQDVMKEQFGPLRGEAYPEIGRSNMFIGNYLRFFWLCEIEEYDKVIDECLEYFKNMADRTGTLWEHDQATASCNHGFASVAAVLLLRCLIGYIGVKNNNPMLKKDFQKNKNLINVKFNY